MKTYVSLPIAMVFLGVNFVSPKIGILLTCAFATYLIFDCNVRNLAAILVCMLSPADFKLSGYGGLEHVITSYVANYFVIAGFPLSVSLCVGVSIFLKVVYDVLAHPHKQTKHTNGFLFWIWLSLFPLAILMAFMGKQEGNNGWATGMRSLLMAGSYFYGIILSRSWDKHLPLVNNQVFPIFFTIYAVRLLIPFHHRIFWIGSAIVPVLFIYIIKRPSLLTKACAALMLFLCFSYSFDYRLFNAFGLRDGGSLTLMGLFAASTCLGLFAFFPSYLGFLKTLAGGMTGWPFIIFLFCFLGYGIANYETLYTPYAASTVDLKERFKEKLWGDRLNVWYYSWLDITESDYFLRPVGRSWVIRHQKRGEIDIDFGSHNTVLQQLRVNRMFVGPGILLIVFSCVLKNGIVYRLSNNPELKVLAVSTVVTGTVGVFTGHYPLSEDAALWFLGFGGLAFGMLLKDSALGFRWAHPAHVHRTQAVRELEALPHAFGDPLL